MPIFLNETEALAEKLVTAKKRNPNWNSLEIQLSVLAEETKIRREREVRATDTMKLVAERDAATAEKYGGAEAWQEIYQGPDNEHRRLLQTIKANPELPTDQAWVAAVTALGLEREAEEKRQAALVDQTDELLKRLNRATQKRQPPNPKHPLYKIAKKERRLERELNPKPRKQPVGEDWRKKLTAGRHWQDALKWFKMTPAEKAAAEGEIVNAVNTKIGTIAQALAGQAEWNQLEEIGAAAQLDFSGRLKTNRSSGRGGQ